MTRRSLSLLFAAGAVSLLLLTTAGCPDKPRARRGPSLSGAPRAQADQTALFDSIRDKLRQLPESSPLELTPPAVVLDARSSLDGEEIEAILVRDPATPNGPAQRLVVPRRNCRFRDTVRVGDLVRYFADPDKESLERNQAGDFDQRMVKFNPLEGPNEENLEVAQVLSNHELLINVGYAREEPTPRKLEIWRTSDDRMDDISRSFGEYVKRRTPALGWQPSPDQAALGTLTESLNQWLRQSRSAGEAADSAGWTRPELLATLPDSVAGDKAVAELLTDASLGAGYFQAHETRQIQAAAWNRDITSWARGGATSPTDIAVALLDWTARNVQPVDPEGLAPRLPWEAVLHGQGSVSSIAELLVGLCRQQELTTSVLEVPVADSAPRLLVGVLDGKQLRLLDPQLGLPLPGSASGEVTTLAEALADDAVLRRLDLPDAPYPITSEALASAKVFVVASPLQLSRRMKAFANKLGGENRVFLHVDIDAEAERLAQADGVESVALWPAPVETLIAKHTVKPKSRRQAVREFLPFAWRPRLWVGRMRHLRGANLDAGPQSALATEAVNDHLVAKQRYMNRIVRPGEQRLTRVAKEKRGVYRLAKTMATLFLAQLSYDGEAYSTAQRWLEEPVLSQEPAASYRPAVDYNLGRVFERLEQTEAAAKAYKAVTGPRRHGALIRAQRLGQETPQTPTEAS